MEPEIKKASRQVRDRQMAHIQGKVAAGRESRVALETAKKLSAGESEGEKKGRTLRVS